MVWPRRRYHGPCSGRDSSPLQSPKEVVSDTLEGQPVLTLSRHLQGPGEIESVSYEFPGTKQFAEFHQRQKAEGHMLLGWLWRCSHWLLLGGIGVVTGLVAVCVEMGIRQLYEVREWLNDWIVSRGVGVVTQYFVFLAVCVSYVAAASGLVCFWEVLAAGSGVPEIKCYLNGIKIPEVVGLRVLIAKWVGVTFSVSSGLPCGNEGPMIHSGAVVGAMAPRMERRLVRRLRLAMEHRDMVAAGAAAGVAAAFNAPLGGVLFAVEEGASYMDPVIMIRVFMCCAFAAGTSRLLLTYETYHRVSDSFDISPWSILGTRAPVSLGRFSYMDYSIGEMFIFAMMGAMGGLLGTAWISLTKRITQLRKRYVPQKGRGRFLEALLVTAVISSVNFWVPVLAEGGEPARFPARFLLPGNHTGCLDFQEPRRGRNELEHTEGLFWRTGLDSMGSLLHECRRSFRADLLLVFACLNFVTSSFTYGLGVPCGLFVPMLVIGGAFGRVMGETLRHWFPGLIVAQPGIYAFVGAASMLAGTARITISLATMLMECTGDAVFGLPLFLAVIVAKWVGDHFGRGIYDMAIIEVKHVPILEPRPESSMRLIAVRDAMARDLVTFSEVETVGNLVRTLQSCTHNGFPVLYSGTRRLAGTVERKVLHSILHSDLGYDLFQQSALPRAKVIPYEVTELAKWRQPDSEVLSNMKAEDCQKVVNLTPYINRNGYMIAAHASLHSCYTFFRAVGLRHLPVVCSNGSVCGMITRKDLILAEEMFNSEELDEGEEFSFSDASEDGTISEVVLTKD